MVGGGFGAAVGGGVGAHYGQVIKAMRQAGLNSVDEIVRDALLNPERARALLAKVGAEPTKGDAIRLSRVYMRAVLTAGDGQTRQESPSVPVSHAAPAVSVPRPGAGSLAERLMGVGP